MKHILRGFLPVVVDLETGGFNEQTDALLEIAAVFLELDRQQLFYPCKTVCYAVKPFTGANLEESSLKVNHIDPLDPARNAVTEQQALNALFDEVSAALTQHDCKRAIMVGHNTHFDLKFLTAAMARNRMDNSPFHAFSTIDTVTLGALACGQTVLSRVTEALGIPWDDDQAHSARYDAEVTAQVFCNIFNRRWRAQRHPS